MGQRPDVGAVPGVALLLLPCERGAAGLPSAGRERRSLPACRHARPAGQCTRRTPHEVHGQQLQADPAPICAGALHHILREGAASAGALHPAA